MKENCDVMTSDIPNAFIQAHIPKTKAGDERVVMKITGMMVDLLVQLSPNTYGQHVVFKRGTKVISTSLAGTVWNVGGSNSVVSETAKGSGINWIQD